MEKGRAEPAAPALARGGAAPAVPITVARVTRKTMPLALQAVGTVEASSTVAVRAQITGALTSVNFNEGDNVAAGQVLFTLDRRPLESALKQAEANLARDVAQAANAKVQAQRLQQLVTRGIVTRDQADSSAASATALEAVVGADRAAVETATAQLQYATITSPISGRTGSLMVHPGNLVRNSDTTPLVVINQLSPALVSFGIPENQLAALKRYMARGSVQVEARPTGDEAASNGRISFIDNFVDPTTGAIKVKATFRNADQQLWPGQFVQVVVTLAAEADALVVPSVAVQTGPQGPYLFVVKNDQTADLKPVVVARTSGAETILASGVSEGETVVTDGQLRLVPGSRISLKSNQD